jgi:nucleoid DNA-binding protein
MEKNNTAYLKRFSDIIRNLSKKHDIPEQELSLIVDRFFLLLRSWLTDLRMPTIKISNLGTFKPSLKKIDNHIRKSIQKIRDDHPKSDMYRKRVAVLWAVRRRLKDESNGAITWKEWRNKKLD